MYIFSIFKKYLFSHEGKFPLIILFTFIFFKVNHNSLIVQISSAEDQTKFSYCNIFLAEVSVLNPVFPDYYSSQEI